MMESMAAKLRKVDRKEFLSNIKRVVLKVGTNILSENGKISLSKFERIVDEIVTLKSYIKDVVVVSSGAVGAGYTSILAKEKPMTIPLKQASASIGQVMLMKNYMELLGKRGFIASQILLTDSGLSQRIRYVNAKNTFNTLFQFDQVIPIINENDTVVVDEIKFGDNDKLAALVSSLVDADLLILLSDVDGFYVNYDDLEKRSRLSEIHEITPELETEAKLKGSSFSTGGMKAKIEAAKITSKHGIPTLLACGQNQGIIKNIFAGDDVGTLFMPVDKGKSNKKRWLHLNSKAKGYIYVDDNAAKALTEGNKSLLPSGISHAVGHFQEYDPVEIVNLSGCIIAKGISNYDSEEIGKIKGRHSSEITGILGYQNYDVVVHKDNLVVVTQS